MIAQTLTRAGEPFDRADLGPAAELKMCLEWKNARRIIAFARGALRLRALTFHARYGETSP
jgi:hypothetical protein